MREKDAREKRFEELKAQAESDEQNRNASGSGAEVDVTMADFEPDWNASQFWYDDETSKLLAEELTTGATEETLVGLVSAPSVFVKLRMLMVCISSLIAWQHGYRFFWDNCCYYCVLEDFSSF